MDVIKDLLRIKLYREERAELAVSRTHYAFLEADKSLKKASDMLDKFQNEFFQKETEMYQDLCSRIVVLKDIDSVSFEMQLMKDRNNQLLESIEEAKEMRNLAAEEFAHARAVHREAVRLREKFSELKRAQDAEVQMEVARVEDLEIEEAASTRYAPSDN